MPVFRHPKIFSLTLHPADLRFIQLLSVMSTMDNTLHPTATFKGAHPKCYGLQDINTGVYSLWYLSFPIIIHFTAWFASNFQKSPPPLTETSCVMPGTVRLNLGSLNPHSSCFTLYRWQGRRILHVSMCWDLVWDCTSEEAQWTLEREGVIQRLCHYCLRRYLVSHLSFYSSIDKLKSLHSVFISDSKSMILHHNSWFIYLFY